MKKAFVFLILYFVVSLSLFSQNAPILEPVNPAFTRYMEEQNSGKAPQPGTDKFGSDAIPPPVLFNFDNYLKNGNLKSTDFAEVYDMRTTGEFLTPVKGQTDNVSCWAFATMASVESHWLKEGLGKWDLSENNLKYCHGFDPATNNRGNHLMATAYFARGSGPLAENDDPYGTISTCPTGKTPVAFITDARYLPHNRDAIKTAILEQGAIFTLMYFYNTYFDQTTNKYTYYYSGSEEQNHAVNLVGWDDNKVTAAVSPGAWICRNSYGATWGEAGYFYVSYSDEQILKHNAYWPTRSDYSALDTIYGYDKLGYNSSIGYIDTVGYMLVKFIASAPQLLSKVGTYATASGENIEIDIFSDFDTTKNVRILSGLLSHTGGVLCPLPGYYACNLSTPVLVQPGDDFYVRIKYRTIGTNDQIPIERKVNGSSDPFIESNVAWISKKGDNGSWYLIGKTNTDYSPYYQVDPCIKVYAEPAILTWNGSVSNDWNTAANWSPAILPNAAVDVVIPANATMNPVVNQPMATPAVCKNLTINAGSSVTLNMDKALTVIGNFTNSAGNSGLVLETGASLITMGDVTGTATVKRFITGGRWHFISPPVSNALSGIFTGKYLQKHTESTNAYTYITSVIEPLVPVKGYALWSTGDFTASYSGVLNTGLNSISLTRTSTDLTNSGWNLVGNPFPSSIDWDAASGWNKYNVNSSIYIEKDGGWATYISGIGSTPGEGTNLGSRYIASGQGFFVSVASDQSIGTLRMDDNVRVHNATAFFKNSSARSLVRLKVSGNGYSDEALVRFIPEATSDYDPKYDAVKLFGTNTESAQIYTLGGNSLTINSLPPDTREVALGIKARKTGKYSIAVTEISNIEEVILEDTKTGSVTLLSSKPYLFTFEKGEKELRFKLYFNSFIFTGTDETRSSLATVYSFNQNVYIKLNEQVKGDIFIYTMEGKLAASRFSARGINSISLPGAGIYIVKVSTEQSTVVKKVFIQ